MGSSTSPQSARHQVSDIRTRIYLRPVLHPCPRTTTAWAGLPSCVTPSLAYYQPGSRPHTHIPERTHMLRRLAQPDSALARQRRYGNINPLSIDYACRPRLRSRLTLGGKACPRNPWSSGGRDSHPSFATHACILTRMASTTRSPRRFTRHTTLPYPRTHLDTKMPGRCVHAAASAVRLSPATLSARNHLTSELLRTLSRVAASKPTSWLSMRLHILSHLAHA